MHGSVLGDQAGEASLELKATPGLLAKDGDLYKLFRNVRSARAGRDFTVTFTDKNDPRVGTRIHLLADPAATAILGETPALRPAGHYNDRDVFKWRMPHLIFRRDDGSRSVFAAVYDTFGDGPQIAQLKRLPGDAGSCALRIAFADGRSDTLLFSMSGPRRMTGGGGAMEGTLGCVVNIDGKNIEGKSELYLIEGTEIEAAGRPPEGDAPVDVAEPKLGLRFRSDDGEGGGPGGHCPESCRAESCRAGY